jgi:alkylated DNA repair protein (DNA oxidative demethylase)
MTAPFRLRGFTIYKGFLARKAQELLITRLREVIAVAPLFQPVTARGANMSVKMSAAGSFGWVSDRNGYRYERCHPNGSNWPQIPDEVLQIWQQVGESSRSPECCLINYYGQEAKMGMHQDRDEVDFSQPVVSISLGDAALFRIGNETRGGKTESLWLESGDVCVMTPKARLTYHGVDRIKFGSSTLLRQGGRINLTLRVVT